MGSMGTSRKTSRPRLPIVFGESVEMLGDSLQEDISIRLLFKTKRHRLKDVSPSEWSMIHRWVHEVLRWKLTIDILIEDVVQKRVTSQHPLIAHATELLVYGIIWDKRPIPKMLRLLKGFLKQHSIRTPKWVEDLAFSVQHVNIQRYSPGGGKLRSLAFRYSLPIWYVQKTLHQLSEAIALDLFDSLSQEPSTRYFWISPFSHNPSLVEASLRESGILFSKDCQLSNTYVLNSPVETLFRHHYFQNHQILLQDWGSIAIGQSLPIEKGDLVLDSAAAPGNKTLQLLAKNPAYLVAADVGFQRTRLLRDRLNKYHAFQRVGVIQYTGIHPCFSRQFDKILLDAPCSGTGTFASRPELKWKVKPTDIDRFSNLQLTLLSSLSKHVKSRGKLLYATCSTLFEENEHVINSFLENNPGWHLSEEMAVQIPRMSPLIKSAYRIFPSDRGAEAYFLALLEKE